MMDLGFRFLCKAETKRLVSLLGIVVVLILVVQYSELPYTKLLSSVTSKITSFSISLPNSELEGSNSTHPNGSTLSSTHAFEDVASVPLASQLGQGRKSSVVHNSSVSITPVSDPVIEKAKGLDTIIFNNSTPRDGSYLASQGDSPFLLAPQPMALLPNRTPLDSAAGSRSPMIPVASNSTSMDQKSGSLQGNNLKVSNDKSVNGKNFKGKPSKVVPISEMNLMLQHSHSPSQLLKPKRSSNADLEIFHARSEIENAPIILNDARLYSPLYRNLSMFKRSYELMEKMLKVYIYQDGDRPIFHEPLLDGIYASEGWFLKLMEASTQFVTGDPAKAHLFYIPFSSRLLQLTLYKRNSHSRLNLVEYMKNYVDMIAGKYPFWNRTDGADHFVVACHDWAPAETRGRMLNCIRALCNADIEVGFKVGKDVSLAETYIRSAKNPVKNIGGNPLSHRPTLAFFAGGFHGYVRPILLKHWQDKHPDMKITGPLPHVKGNANYIELMKSSKYCICARGHEVNSPRVVEAIFHECIPVIISDNFIPPLFEVLNWESFAVFIMEEDIPNLRNILLSIPEETYLEMHKRVKRVQEHFLWHAEPVKYDLFHMLLHSIWYNRLFRIGHT